MRNKLAVLLLLLGAALMIGALSLYGYNQWENAQAGQQSASHLSALVSQIETREQIPEIESREETQKAETKPLPLEACVMKEVDIDGNAYIGYLSIPELELELPVMSQWNYDALQVAPCRYTGTMKGEDLVVLAHNYEQHFGRIASLPVGTEVAFTDMEGMTYRYTVTVQEVLDASAVEEMTAGEYALSLFTCTYDSQSRAVVRCERKK